MSRDRTYDPNEGEFVDFETLADWEDRDKAKDARIEALEAQVKAADALASGPVVVMKFLDCVFTFKDRNEALRFSKRLRDEVGETISDHCEYDVSSCDSAFETALAAYRAAKEGGV